MGRERDSLLEDVGGVAEVVRPEVRVGHQVHLRSDLWFVGFNLPLHVAFVEVS